MTHIYYTTGSRTDTAVQLPRAAARYCAALGAALPDLTIARAPGGKPYFPAAPWLHFSVSHSGDVWLCALSDAPVGVDVQYRQPTREAALARRFFHPREVAWLGENPDSFFRLWTAKEACVKLTGQGIDGAFGRFSVIANGTFAAPIHGAVLRHLPFAEGYVLCLCGADGAAVLHEL